MAIIRPVAAFCSAFVAGVLQLIFNNEEEVIEPPKEEVKSCCSKNKKNAQVKLSGSQRVLKAVRFGYGELINDIALWLLIGIFAGALIDFVVPENFFLQYGSEVGRYLILLVGIPLYICATASTPIAVSLILKGLSPGAALMLLLVGPATNISNIAVLQKYIGKKGVVINMISIAVVALIFSYITDWLYANYFTLKLNEQLVHHHSASAWWEIASAIILGFLLLKGVYFEELKPRFSKKQMASCH